MKQIGSSDWRDAYYCTPEEILAVVGGESIDIQSIKDERKKCVFVREGDAVIWGDTEQVQKFFGKIYNTSEAISETLQGFSANTGKITGTVKIVLSTKDFYKVQRGDILVTTMTSVDFVPIMEKAGAFVTNEGGITSHAAIVAREMDKPCIIGTKHATRMLKDGDLVEVDADNGVVKMLKNNSEPDFSHKNLEVWIERKQSIFSMSVFHELESEVMKQHLGGGFRAQICFMKDKICSYIHEIGDFENVVNAIAKKIKNSSEQEIREMIEKMNSWEKIGKKIIKEGHSKVMISKASRKKYLENYKNIGYWTTVVPYFLLEAINTIENQTAYKDLKTVCERLRSNSLYPILNEEITHKILEELTDTLGLEKGDWYYITWHETMNILKGNMPQNIESIKKRKNKENAFYRSKNGQVIFLENKENIQNLSEISYPKNTLNTINGVTAYPGKVQGKVKILRTTSDMRDFEQGDILVSPNSNPSLMACIKKCGAMITDEGGVSCHAAIISRELQKPCIIGTKIATKVLKDGDMVEVDADKGVIKIMTEEKFGFNINQYQRLFSFYGHLPFILSYIFAKSYIKFGGIVFSNEHEWLSFINKENIYLSLDEGIKIYGDKKVYDLFKKNLYKKMKEIEKWKKEVTKKGINKKQFGHFIKLITEYRDNYTKTEFFYTEKIFEKQQDYPDFQKNFETFEKLKLDGRNFLNKIFYSEKSIFGEVIGIISKKLNIEKNDLFLHTTEEILEAFDDKKTKKEVFKKRKNVYFLLINNKKINIQLEGEAEKRINYIKKENNKNSLSGEIASRGKVTANAYVIKVIPGTEKNLSKIVNEMPEGSILVAETTEPTIVIACKKASAIITNQGGMMSHAATISRELKIPCIVGLGNATDLINTGDLVEVDANNGIVKIIEKNKEHNPIKQEKWVKNVTREVTVFPAASVTKSFGQISDIFEVPFNYEHILFVGNTWYYKQSDYERLKNIFLQKIEDNQNYVTHIAKKQKKAGERLKKFVQKLPKKIITEEISKILKEYEKKMTEFYAFWWIAIPVGDILEGQVRKILEKQSEIDFDELMFVREELELVREKRLRNAIGIECQKYKKYKDLPKTIQKKLIQHAEKFGWINTSYHVGIGLSARNFFEKIKTENPQELIQEMEKQRETEKNTLTKIKKYVSIEDQSIIESMQAIMYLRNYQKETVNECQHNSEKFLEKIATGIGLKRDVFLSFSMEEILIYLQDKIPEKMYNKIAKQRLDGFVIEWKNKKISVYEKDIKKHEGLVKQEIIEKNTQINGSVAYPGKINGTVRVIKKKSDINSFIPGEILVTNMTSIDYVHIMGRASGIITNEGGITCHAAIFSRELKIPCIIGTKNATEILKNGDFIELNGQSGAVKVIQSTNKTVAT